MPIKNIILNYQSTGLHYPFKPIKSGATVARFMRGAFDMHPDQEQCWVILLNSKNIPLGRHLCTVGTVAQSLVHPREVFRAAVLAAASAIILIHNHPSGDPTPSEEDRLLTSDMRHVAAIMQINIFDHVIIGNEKADPTRIGYYSFRDRRLL